MANIQKRERKSGTVYLADVRIHGFPRQKKTFKRLTDAKLWAQQTEAAIRKGEFQNVVSTARSKTLNGTGTMCCRTRHCQLNGQRQPIWLSGIGSWASMPSPISNRS